MYTYRWLLESKYIRHIFVKVMTAASRTYHCEFVTHDAALVLPSSYDTIALAHCRTHVARWHVINFVISWFTDNQKFIDTIIIVFSTFWCALPLAHLADSFTSTGNFKGGSSGATSYDVERGSICMRVRSYALRGLLVCRNIKIKIRIFRWITYACRKEFDVLMCL